MAVAVVMNILCSYRSSCTNHLLHSDDAIFQKNLKKTASMVDGQVGFHRPENVRRCKIAKNNTIVRQLEKSKEELHPDLAQEQQARMREIQKQNKVQRILDQKKKKMEELEIKREKEERSYDRIVGGETSVSGELNVGCSVQLIVLNE